MAGSGVSFVKKGKQVRDLKFRLPLPDNLINKAKACEEIIHFEKIPSERTIKVEKEANKGLLLLPLLIREEELPEYLENYYELMPLE